MQKWNGLVRSIDFVECEGKKMPYRFFECEQCHLKLLLKKSIRKKKVGIYKGDPVFEKFIKCNKCDCIHILKIDTPKVNELRARMMMLECCTEIYREDEKKCEELKREYEVVKKEIEKLIEEVKKAVGME